MRYAPSIDHKAAGTLRHMRELHQLETGALVVPYLQDLSREAVECRARENTEEPFRNDPMFSGLIDATCTKATLAVDAYQNGEPETLQGLFSPKIGTQRKIRAFMAKRGCTEYDPFRDNDPAAITRQRDGTEYEHPDYQLWGRYGLRFEM